jgi:hypothetical protein
MISSEKSFYFDWKPVAPEARAKLCSERFTDCGAGHADSFSWLAHKRRLKRKADAERIERSPGRVPASIPVLLYCL